jgi:hypothetical protein
VKIIDKLIHLIGLTASSPFVLSARIGLLLATATALVALLDIAASSATTMVIVVPGASVDC